MFSEERLRYGGVRTNPLQRMSDVQREMCGVRSYQMWDDRQGPLRLQRMYEEEQLPYGKALLQSVQCPYRV